MALVVAIKNSVSLSSYDDNDLEIVADLSSPN